MTCPDDEWDGWEDEPCLFDDSDGEYDLTPVYPPWWRRPWPIYRETSRALPALPDIATYQPRRTA